MQGAGAPTRDGYRRGPRAPRSPVPGTPAAAGFDDQTVRNIVFTSVGGNLVRVRFTNTFGTTPLQLGAASIAVAGTGPGTAGPPVPLTFGGQRSIQIPDGAEVLSDPVRMYVPRLRDLAVSVYLPQATGPATQHALGQQTNYVAAGDQTCRQFRERLHRAEPVVVLHRLGRRDQLRAACRHAGDIRRLDHRRVQFDRGRQHPMAERPGAAPGLVVTTGSPSRTRASAATGC